MPPVAMSSKDDLSYKSSQSNAAFFPYSSNANPFHVSDVGISRFNFYFREEELEKLLETKAGKVLEYKNR